MADKRLEQLPTATTLGSSDLIHISQSGIDKRINSDVLVAQLNSGVAFNFQVKEESSTERTLSVSDRTSYIRCLNAGITSIIVPPTSDVPWTLGDQVMIRRQGGKVNVSGGSGVTVNGGVTGLALLSGGQDGILTYVGSNTWDLETGGTTEGINGTVTDYDPLVTYTEIDDWVREDGIVYRPDTSLLPIGPEVFDSSKWIIAQITGADDLPLSINDSTTTVEAYLNAQYVEDISELRSNLAGGLYGNGAVVYVKSTGGPVGVVEAYTDQVDDTAVIVVGGTSCWRRQIVSDDNAISPLYFEASWDGVTDDTVAIQAALDLLPTYPLVKFPSGETVFTNLVIPSAARTFEIRGCGLGNTILKTSITSGSALSGVWPDGARSKDCHISGFELRGVPLGAATGIDFSGFSFSDLEYLRVDDFKDNISFGSQCYGVSIDKCKIIHYSGIGVKQGNFNHWMTVNRCQFSSSRGSSSIGFQAFGAETVENEALAITNCDFESSTTGIQLRNGGAPTVSNCYFENNTGTHIRLGWSDRTLTNPTIRNCYFNGNKESTPTAICIDWANYVEGGMIDNPHFLFEPEDQYGVIFNAGDRRIPSKSPVMINVPEEYVSNTGDSQTIPNYINGREYIVVEDEDLITPWDSWEAGTNDGELTITKVNGVVNIDGTLYNGAVGTLYQMGESFTPKSDMIVPLCTGVGGTYSLSTSLFLNIKRNGEIAIVGTYASEIININTCYIHNYF